MVSRLLLRQEAGNLKMGQETYPPRIMWLVHCSCIFVCKLNKPSGLFLSYKPGLRSWPILSSRGAMGPGRCPPRNHAGLLTGPRGSQGQLSKGKSTLDRSSTLLTLSPPGCAPHLTFSRWAQSRGRRDSLLQTERRALLLCICYSSPHWLRRAKKRCV